MLRPGPLALTTIGLAAAALLANCNAADRPPGNATRPVAAAPLVAADEYVRRAGTTGLFEVESGKLALEKSDREDIRALARLVTDDHVRAIEKLREAAAKSLGIASPPARLDSEHQAKLRRLATVEGAEFNQLYLDILAESHQQSLALHRGYAATGDNAALKATAAELVPPVQKHIEALQRIRGTMSAPPPRG